MLLYRISYTTSSIPVVPHLRHHARPPLSSPLTLSAVPIILHLHRASIVILPRLCCGPYCIIFHRSVYFPVVVCLPYPIGYYPLSALFCTTLLDMICSILILSLSNLILSLHFSILERLFYLSVIFSLFSDLPHFFSTCHHSAMLQSEHSPQLCLLRYACSISDMLNYDCSAHALICLLRSALISSLISAPSFVPLDLLISLKITYH